MASLPILRLMNQTIGVAHISAAGTDVYHEPTYSAFVNYPARVEVNPSRTFGQDGQDISSYATVYTTAEVEVMDRIQMPDGSVRQVLNVSKQVARNGTFSHSEVKV